MGLSRTVPEIKGNIFAKFSNRGVFNAPDEGFPLEFCNGGESERTSLVHTRPTIRLVPLPALDRQTDKQTDRQTD